jgi:hypothetical protein
MGLAGCGEEPASTAPARGGLDLTAVRVCELLAASEIETATGNAAAAGLDISQQAAGVPMCRWPPAGGPEYDTLVNLVVTGNYYDSYEEFLASAREGLLGNAFSEDAVRRVDGVGDFGVWLPETGMLQVYDGDVMVQVDAETAPGRDELEAARALALAALAKLR